MHLEPRLSLSFVKAGTRRIGLTRRFVEREHEHGTLGEGARLDERPVRPRLHVDVVKHAGRRARRGWCRLGVREPGGRADHDPALPPVRRLERTVLAELRQLIRRWTLLVAAGAPGEQGNDPGEHRRAWSDYTTANVPHGGSPYSSAVIT